MMESRIRGYIRYIPLLLLCMFPHQIFLVGSMDCVKGISIAPYAVVPALAFSMGAGVVIHIGRELLSEKACSRIFRVQLLLALALIVLACSHLVLLHFRISGSYFYFLYPLQQLLLFTAYALTPAVHALVLQIEVDSRVQQPCDKVADGSMGRFRDYRIIAAYEAFSATFLFACWVVFSFGLMGLSAACPSLIAFVLAQAVIGLCVVMRLVRSREPLVDSAFWDIWPFRFFGSVIAWPVIVCVLECGAPGIAMCCVVIGASLFIMKLRSPSPMKAWCNASDGLVREPSETAERYPVSAMAVQLEGAFPNVDLADRERRCIEMALAGMTSAQIADVLGIKSATVRSYLVRAYRKLGVPDFKGLVERMGHSHQASPSEGAGDEVVMGSAVADGKPESRALPSPPIDVRSVLALLLLMLILGDPRLTSTSLSFITACSIIAGVTLYVVCDRRRCMSRAVRILVEGVAICSIIVFHALASTLQDVPRASIGVHLGLLACAILFIPYLLSIAADATGAATTDGFGRNRTLFAASLLLTAVFLLIASLFPLVRELGIFTLLVVLCLDRLDRSCTFEEPWAAHDGAFEAASRFRFDRFLPFFMLGVVSGVCVQAVLHVDGVLGTDIMLALPVGLSMLACSLYLYRLSCPRRWCVVYLGVGICMVAVGYTLWGSARLGSAYALLMLWAVVAQSRGEPSWRASVHALMFGIAAGAAVGLMEFEIRYVALRALKELQGALPSSFDIEFRALILVGLLLSCSVYVLYEFWTCRLCDSSSIPMGEFERIVSYCKARGTTDLQGLVVAHIADGESGRRIANAVGYSVGSVNSARLAAYRQLGVHNRGELMQLLGRELGIAARPLRS